jgi:hypothetical protein
MDRKTSLDLELVAVETADEVAVLLELTAPAAPRQVAVEVGHRLEHSAQAVSLVIRPADAVAGFTLWNDLPVSGLPEGVMVELGDFFSGEQRRILLGFDVPAMPGLGAASICELELCWVEPSTMTERVARLPVTANTVPGDLAAGRPLDCGCRGARLPAPAACHRQGGARTGTATPTGAATERARANPRTPGRRATRSEEDHP